VVGVCVVFCFFCLRLLVGGVLGFCAGFWVCVEGGWLCWCFLVSLVLAGSCAWRGCCVGVFVFFFVFGGCWFLVFFCCGLVGGFFVAFGFYCCVGFCLRGVFWWSVFWFGSGLLVLLGVGVFFSIVFGFWGGLGFSVRLGSFCCGSCRGARAAGVGPYRPGRHRWVAWSLGAI